MGLEDRDYLKAEQQRYGSGGGGGGGFGGAFGGGAGGGWNVTTWLIVVCAAVFFLDMALGGSQRGATAAPSTWGELRIESAVYGWQLWRYVTAIFVHADLLHVLFNCIGLYFFGRLIEQWWGPRRYLAFFLLCGLAGNVLFVLLALGVPGLLFPAGFQDHIGQASLVGASGGVFGILAGCAVLFPNLRVQLLIPPVPMSMRTMALVFLGLAALTVIAGGRNAGGEAAHLGGAVLGFVLVRWPALLNWADTLNPRAIQAGWTKGRFEARQRKQTQRQEASQAEVDRILDKVRDRGLQSLSAKERRVLQRATDEQRRGG